MDRLRKAFSLSKEEMQDMSESFRKEMEKGLNGNGCLKMIPSFVTEIPDGKEKGNFYALDLGGTNLRVLQFSFDGKGKVTVTEEKRFVVPDNVMKAKESATFHKFIAKCIASVGSDKAETKDFGYTFSFPCKQDAINSGILTTWTKGFSVAEVVGTDVVPPLEAELKKLKYNANIRALVNDTVGTLVAGAFKDPKCALGVIIGTGTNAAYVEKVENIMCLPEETRKKGGIMVVNTEWGAFGDIDKYLPSCSVDETLDRESTHPKKQTLEKMISGMYLGELVRLCLNELVAAGEIYSTINNLPEALSSKYTFETKLLSAIESDTTDELQNVLSVESKYGIVGSTLEDRKLLHEVCKMVVARAARLTAMGISAVVSKMSRDPAKTTVGVDGSVFEHHPTFQHILNDALAELDCSCSLVLAKDGSGAGAALIACGETKRASSL